MVYYVHMQPTIYIAGDHAALEMKKKIVAYLKKKGYTVKDFGPHRYDPDDDYPDFIIPMARAVGRSKDGRGIALGGSGIGECIAANKVRGVRAALVFDLYTARMSREHNDANILCLGARTASTKNLTRVKKILDTWLITPFSGEKRHVRRLKKIQKFDKIIVHR